MELKKLMPYIGVVVSILVAVFVVFAVIKTGDLPFSVEKTFELEKGQSVTFVAPTNAVGRVLQVKIDLSVMTNLVSGLPLSEECWVIIGADPEEAAVKTMTVVE